MVANLSAVAGILNQMQLKHKASRPVHQMVHCLLAIGQLSLLGCSFLQKTPAAAGITSTNMNDILR